MENALKQGGSSDSITLEQGTQEEIRGALMQL